MINNKKISYDLHLFLIITFILIAIGLLFIYSASSVLACEKYGNSSYFLKKQLIGLGLGLIALIVARYFPLQLLIKISPFTFIASLLLTALTLIPSFAHHIHGSSRWLAFGRFSFQPSELLKIGLIVYVASFLTKKEFQKKSLVHCYMPLLLILGITSIILLRQPDFGLTVTLLITTGIMLFIAHIPLLYLMSTIAALLPVLITLVIMRPYRLNRILSFLNPWNDPQGSGFQIIQSLIAIGSGGIFGLGIGQSKQKFFYLPMQHTDFIFSIIAEEIGFFGSCIVIMLFIALIYVGLRLSTLFNNQFSFFATVGFVCLLALETAINIAVATGLAPTKGIGLPFISYGNSALIGNLIIVGLIMNMAHHEERLQQR
ncbi:MAG: putative lipid II flippase FtsW [Candidatus Dependentiae bacterium]|nr:putative lipid II flippase FtsW [Candidatus Dependentiae bacterium]